jgi:preprotein translocase subunit SecG
VSSLTTRFNQCSPATIYFTLIFLILALIFATLYFRKEKAGEPIEAEVVTKE